MQDLHATICAGFEQVSMHQVMPLHAHWLTAPPKPTGPRPLVPPHCVTASAHCPSYSLAHSHLQVIELLSSDEDAAAEMQPECITIHDDWDCGASKLFSTSPRSKVVL